MKEKKLKEAFEAAVIDWEQHFNVDIEQEDNWCGFDYFSVVLTHDRLGPAYELRCRVDNDGNCEMDYYEDSWQPITMGNLFAWMWFEVMGAVICEGQEISAACDRITQLEALVGKLQEQKAVRYKLLKKNTYEIAGLRKRIAQLEEALELYIRAGSGTGTHYANQDLALKNAMRLLEESSDE